MTAGGIRHLAPAVLRDTALVFQLPRAFDSALEAWAHMQKTGKGDAGLLSERDLQVLGNHVCFFEVDTSLFIDLTQQRNQVFTVKG